MRRLKHPLHKSVSGLAVWSIVALVIQFQPQERPHRLIVAEQEVDMFPVHPIHKRAVLPVVSALSEEKVAQRYFRAHAGSATYNREKHLVKAQLSARQEVIAEPKRKLALASCRLVLGGEPIEDTLDRIEHLTKV
jgi:hypothetical protein